VSAEHIAGVLGGFRAGCWWRCRCPVHGSRQATLALRDGDLTLVVYCHAGCPRADIIGQLKRMGLFDGTYKPETSRAAPPSDRDSERNRDRALKIWNEAKLAERSPLLRRYLQSRGITIAVPRTLRWARSIKHPTGGLHSAMIARVDDAAGDMIAVQRTYLLPDGSGKAPVEPERLSLGPVKGGAVRLAAGASAPLLMISEGVETALSAMQACELPAWAALSTSGLKNLILPAEIREIIILADNDLNGAGQHAARIAAQRWRSECRKVRIALPPNPGTDFNDVLRGQRNAA
jgi:putative DNA primase/helicase